MTHPKKLQKMLDRLKWQDLKYHAIVLCEYQIKTKLDKYEVMDKNNFKRLYYYRVDNSKLDAAMYELIKDKKITYLSFAEMDSTGDCYNEERTEYKHPNYTGIFVCDDIWSYAEEVTEESHAKLLFEIAYGDYDEQTGEYIGYSGDYANFSATV